MTPETIRREYPLTVVVREDGPDAYSVDGLAVPYDTPSQISDYLGNYAETVARDAFDPAQVEGSPLMYRHDQPIGVITRAWSSERGLMVTGKFSDTQLARETRTLARDGAIRGMSIQAEMTAAEWAADGSSVTWTKGIIREISLTPFPAHTDAQLTAVRERDTMTETETRPAQLTEQRVETIVRDQLAREDGPTQPLTVGITELREQIALLQRELASGRPGHVYTVAREFHADLWSGRKDPEAAARIERALGTGVMATDGAGLDPQNVLSTVFGDVRRGRPTAAAIGVRPLPQFGMSVDVPTITQDPSTADYPTELAAVAGTDFTVAFTNAPVFTEAGGSEVSRAWLDRSSPDGLALLTSRYAEIYARRYNARVVARLATATQTAAFPTGAWSVSGIGETLADAATQIVTAGGMLEVVTLAPDLYFPLALVSGVGFPLAGGQQVGSANLGSLTFEAFGVTFVCDPLLGAGVGYALCRDAIMPLESPGAPFNIRAPKPANIADDMAVYGYGAIVTNDLDQAVKLSKTA